jgi:ATP-dependent Clp protease protease subunit
VSYLESKSGRIAMPEARYILPEFEERTSYGFKRHNPYTKLFEDRIVFLGVQVDDASADDIMQYIRPQIQTVCLGQAASAAAVLLAAGSKGKRLALPNARVLIHQPATGGSGQGQASDIEIQAKEIMRMREWLEDTLAKHSGKSKDQVHKDIDRDKILTAQEAVEYGLIDQVLTTRKA